MRIRAVFAIGGLITGSFVVVAGTAVPPAHAVGERHVDFNNDGYDDLVVPANGESVGSIAHAGAVTIMYGSPSGLTGTGAITITEDTAGVPDAAEPRDNFGYTHAEGDFNGDHYTDLAVGSTETIGSTTRAGAVTVLWGSSHGITTTGSKMFTGNSAGVGAAQQPYAYFGGALAAGDFDGSGTVDLAVSASGAPIQGVTGAGLVTFLRGSSGGLTASGQVVRQGVGGMSGQREKDDQFGYNMVAGDLNADGRADLLIGTPYEDAGTDVDSGVVDIVYGSATGLVPVHNKSFAQAPSAKRYLGANVVINDLVSPAAAYGYGPGDKYNGIVYKVLPNDSRGLVHYDGGIAPEDQCGLSLIFGNFAGAGSKQPLIGCPGYRNFSGGAVRVMDPNQGPIYYTEDTPGFQGAAEPDDDLGWAMERRDLNGDGWDDAVIGVPFEDAGSVEDVGTFYVMYGNSTRLNASHVQLWSQESSGVPGSSEVDDIWGYV